jgi:hypothetical protein
MGTVITIIHGTFLGPHYKQNRGPTREADSYTVVICEPIV